MLRGFLPVNFLRWKYIWRVWEKENPADLRTKVLTRTSEILSAHYNKSINTTRNYFHCFNKAKHVPQDQWKGSTRTNPHRTIICGCAVQFFVDHEHTTDTFISIVHFPDGRRMTVAIMCIFQYCGKTFHRRIKNGFNYYCIKKDTTGWLAYFGAGQQRPSNSLGSQLRCKMSNATLGWCIVPIYSQGHHSTS